MKYFSLQTPIAWSSFSSPFGQVLVVGSPHGLQSLTLGEHVDELKMAYLKRAAMPTASPTFLQPWLDVLQAYLNDQQPCPSLPLDLTATPFQWQVWAAVQHIPLGSTRSYQQIAAQLGKTAAASRAVACACASNPVALVIPCHRVIRSDGNFAGYRWGMARKVQLLHWEAQQAQNQKG